VSVDIKDAAAQDAVATSLLSAPIVGSWREGPLAESGEHQPSEGAEQLADLSTDRDDWRVENQPVDPLVAQEAAKRNAEQREQPEQQVEQPAPPTPEQIQEGIQHLDTFVRENGLNDPESARGFASEMCEAFGTDMFASGVNVEALGQTMAKTACSALRMFDELGGDLSKMPPIPAESAQAFAHDFMKAWGADSRATPVNAQLLTQTVLSGALNFIGTYHRFGGKVTDMAQLNQPEAAEQFLGQFLHAFGIEAPPDRAAALRFADAGGKYLLSFMNRLGQLQPREQPRTSSKRSSGRRQSARTNVFEDMELPKTIPKKGEDFSPKGRRARASFQTNKDIFGDDTMRIYEREHGRL
jgi:hypothetical protein